METKSESRQEWLEQRISQCLNDIRILRDKENLLLSEMGYCLSEIMKCCREEKK